MQEKQSELDLLNAKVALVTFEGVEAAKRYLAEIRTSYPIFIDTERNLYKAYGMEQAGFRDIWGPATWIAYIREFLKGRFPKRSAGDISQRGGDILIDPDGIVRMHHIGAGPAARPSVDSILRVIRKGE